MKILLAISLLPIFRAETSLSIIEENEVSIATNILKQMEIQYAVYLSDTRNDLEIHKAATCVRMTSALNIIGAFWNINQFISYMNSVDQGYYKVAFIVKNLDAIQDALMHFDKISKYTWVVFDDNIKLSIPYNCEFIRIQKIHSTAYKLTEIYMVKNKIFVNDFGTFDFNSGLKIQDATMYQRRLDLNGSVINSVTLDFIDSNSEVSCTFIY